MVLQICRQRDILGWGAALFCGKVGGMIEWVKSGDNFRSLDGRHQITRAVVGGDKRGYKMGWVLHCDGIRAAYVDDVEEGKRLAEWIGRGTLVITSS